MGAVAADQTLAEILPAAMAHRRLCDGRNVSRFGRRGEDIGAVPRIRESHEGAGKAIWEKSLIGAGGIPASIRP